MRKEAKMLFAVVVAIAMVSTIGTGALAKKSMGKDVEKLAALSYKDEWRKLWEDHVTWTRIVIIGVLDDLNPQAVENYTARLLKNAGDMGLALEPVYGKLNAGKFSGLVEQHLIQAAGILKDLKTGTDPTNDLKAWYQNAHDIAFLMSQLNPVYWKLDKGDRMWKEHLDATVNETLANLGHDWMAEVAAYNMIVSLALMMADFTSTGIMKQMPQMFNGVAIAFN